MFFLLRVAFWLSIVLVLLPSGSPAPQAGSNVSAVDAMSAAGAAVSDATQFCDRQPDACVVGSQAAVVFGQRAAAGAKMVYDFFTEQMNRSETGSIRKTASKDVAPRSAPPSQHTLKPSDLQPGWRGPAPHKDAQGKSARKDSQG